MARPGVTYTEIASAAQQIAASGRFPTVEGVRLILGTGSNSTVGQHLRTWKMKQDSTQQIATKENIPEALIAAIKGVWEVVMTQSETAIQTIQDGGTQTFLRESTGGISPPAARRTVREPLDSYRSHQIANPPRIPAFQ